MVYKYFHTFNTVSATVLLYINPNLLSCWFDRQAGREMIKQSEMRWSKSLQSVDIRENNNSKTKQNWAKNLFRQHFTENESNILQNHQIWWANSTIRTPWSSLFFWVSLWITKKCILKQKTTSGSTIIRSQFHVANLVGGTVIFLFEFLDQSPNDKMHFKAKDNILLVGW